MLAVVWSGSEANLLLLSGSELPVVDECPGVTT